MLLVGEYNCIPSDIDNLFIYNLSSMIEGYQKIGILPSVNNINYIDELNFDISYSNYIMTNDSVFYEFFSKIIYPLYNGYSVYLITARNDFFDRVTESLLKFIQQRYGYISAIMNDPTDIDYINQDVGFGSTGIYGVYNLDLDKERYSYMYASTNMDKNGKIKGFD
jgi:hypothetical protein